MIGYWFLVDAGGWQPPEELLRFLEAGEKPVSIGFGSMTGREPQKIDRAHYRGGRQSGQRAVLLAGWASIGDARLPDSIFRLSAAPRSWLFPRIAGVVHHGGAGTMVAVLRAGVSTVVVPHFADQPFWGKRIQALGLGPKPILRPKFPASRLANAIQAAVTDPALRRRASDLAGKIRTEDGIGTALGVNFVGSFIRQLISAFVAWLIWAAVTYFVGTSLFKGKSTIGEMLRVLGFAQAPGLLVIIPICGAFVGWLWTLACSFIAIRQGLDIDNTSAFFTAVIALIVVILVNVVIGLILGALGLGVSALQGLV
jgi:hypothetical protein